MFPRDNILETFTVMHYPVFEHLDTLSIAFLVSIILYIDGKQFRCSVFTFVQYIKGSKRKSSYLLEKLFEKDLVHFVSDSIFKHLTLSNQKIKIKNYFLDDCVFLEIRLTHGNQLLPNITRNK